MQDENEKRQGKLFGIELSGSEKICFLRCFML